MKILLIGFGDLAHRLAPRLIEDGCDVSALRRTPGTVPGVRLFSGDCRDSDVLARALAGQEVVVVTLTPGAFTEQGYRDAYVASARALAQALGDGTVRPRLVLWVSSTSVYGENQGEWVNEDTLALPRGFSGRCLLEAEKIVGSLPVQSVVVRFSGIYGPGRSRLIEQVRRGQGAPQQPVQWSNRIHSEDCAGVLHHLIRRHREGAPLDTLYIGTDCAPVPLHDVHQWLAQQLSVAITDEAPTGSARGNRRCSNDRLLASGYRFLYPTWREGYAALLNLVSGR